MRNAFWIALSSFCLLALSFSAQAASGYKGGSGDSVKSWGARDFESARTADMPMIIYIFDPLNNNNSIANHYETKVIANAEVKDKLKGFLTMKIKTDGTDVRGWPADILGRAGKGAAVMIASSDMAQVIFIDRNTPKEVITSMNLIGHIATIASYEERKKLVADKTEKKAAEEKKPEDKKTVPGLALDDKDKKDAKKPPEKKKAAAPSDE